MGKTMKRILIAFDGSDHAERALSIALDLAQKYSAETQLLTVVPPLVIPPMYLMLVTTRQLIDEVTKQIEYVFRKVLETAEERVRQEKPKLKMSAKIEYGRPEEKIVETAKEGHFDLIVMGSRGLSRMEYALGSVSSGVADNATCPVLIVK
jgi:nucleotide-binding universal stress UspA family protein